MPNIPLALVYFTQVTLTLLKVVSPLQILTLFLGKTTKVTLKKQQISLYIDRLFDLVILKEAVIDSDYEKYFQVEKGDTVIDIGASIGDFTSLVSQRAKKVYAVEIDSGRLKMLNKNIKLNQCQNVVLIPHKLKSLNELFQKYKIRQCDFLKMDCEGCEYDLFQDTSDEIICSIRQIAMEVHVDNMSMKGNYSILRERFRRLGFQLNEVRHNIMPNILLLYAYRT